MKQHFSIFLFALLFFACSKEASVIQYQDIEKDLQAQFIMTEDNSTINLPEGNFIFTGTLSLEGKKNVTIKGAGKEKTVLSFKGQTEGAEGLKVSNCEKITLEDFTIEDSKGDCIKVRKTDGLVFRNVIAQWTGEPKETNGSYAFYPVDCDNVLVEFCSAIGASDAGIYVGQSRDVIVRNCFAQYNVAGIEIENCIRADVYNCEAMNNTGGILVFDMPGLTQAGNGVRIFNNFVHNNNYRNFAPEGNIVGEVPPGTGVMVLATDGVEIFDNEIKDNKTIGTAIVSYLLVKKPHKDKAFDPYPRAISVYNNKYSRGFFQFPTFENDLGKLMMFRMPFSRPDIIYDGILDPESVNDEGIYEGPLKICIGENGGARFAMIDASNEFQNMETDRTKYDCSLAKLKPVVLN